MNSVSLTGRLAREPEVRFTQNDVAVCSFSMAVDRPHVKDTVDFIECVAWRSTAEFIGKYFHKGDGIEALGCITSRTYEDKNGNKRKVVEVLCDAVYFPKGKKMADNGGGQQWQSSNNPAKQEFEEDLSAEDCLPF